MTKKLKGIISSILILGFLSTAVTGLLIFFSQSGVIWGIPRAYITLFHSYAAFTMSIGILIHLILNFKVYLGEIKFVFSGSQKAKR